VGLAYFGARYLSLGLGRWMSPDPVTIHEIGSDPNPYAYVMGRPLVAVDPNGQEPITLAAIGLGIVIGAAIGGASAGAIYTATNWDNWSLGGFGMAFGIGALSGAVGGAAGGIATGLLGGGIAVGTGATQSLLIAGAGWSAGSAAVAGGAIGSAAGSVAGGLVANQNLSWEGILLSASLGAASAGIMYYLQGVQPSHSSASDGGAGGSAPVAEGKSSAGMTDYTMVREQAAGQAAGLEGTLAGKPDYAIPCGSSSYVQCVDYHTGQVPAEPVARGEHWVGREGNRAMLWNNAINDEGTAAMRYEIGDTEFIGANGHRSYIRAETMDNGWVRPRAVPPGGRATQIHHSHTTDHLPLPTRADLNAVVQSGTPLTTWRAGNNYFWLSWASEGRIFQSAVPLR